MREDTWPREGRTVVWKYVLPPAEATTLDLPTFARVLTEAEALALICPYHWPAWLYPAEIMRLVRARAGR